MRRGYIFVLALLYASFYLNAQVNATGTLLGTVMDKTGAVVPAASVKVTSKNTGLAREAVTNEAGQYRFDLLPAGTYEVRVSLKGFATSVHSNVELAVSQASTVDATLEPNTQAEVVTVEATGSTQ